ncbi:MULTISPECIES: response regulator [unclassified Microcoleus]|uniref:response regulator n=1 Tax=unclassified Microcoleus TaxID=2642155 RepID=UPI0025F4EA43|nr:MULTISPECIES: response regulator [unclassified Microcoleus]
MSKPVILCVDDEKVVLKSLKTQLKSAFGNTYVYELAENPADALELIDEFNDDDTAIILIVSDWLMPGMKGDEFLIRVHKKFPKIVKVMLTGQADEDAVQRAFDEADLHRCLHKPWSEEELIETIKTALSL